MDKRKIFIRVTCIILAGLMVLGLLTAVFGSNAYAASSSAIQAEIDELNSKKSDIQDRMDEIQSEIDSLDYEKATVLEKKELLDKKNTLAQQELDVIEEQIDIIDGLISNMQEDLALAQEEENTQREHWLARVRAMEEGSDLGYIEVIFNATSFSDLLTRIDLVNEVMVYDEELEEAYIEARKNVEELESQAEVLYAENESARGELEVKQAQLEADIEAATQLIIEMENNIEEYNIALEEERQTQAEVEELIVKKEAELAEAKAAEEAARQAALAAAAAAAAANGTSTGSGGGGGGTSSSGTWMIWPSYTSYITSGYGYRVNPVSGVYKLHSGSDIGASYGSAIYAAASGTVILAGWNGGYGNCVMINHGNGYTTLYGHMSSIAVSDGQSVSQGQVIGYVGSTGNSTGPHLHFEVRSSSTGGTITKDEATGGFLIMAVTKDGPAQAAGIVRGDIILAVDGEDVTQGDTAFLRSLIQADFGKTAVVTVMHEDGAAENFDVSCEEIYSDPVSSMMLDGAVGYAAIDNFRKGAGSEAVAAIEALLEDGAQSLILDVRSNPGGQVTELTELMDYLLPEGDIFIRADKNGNEEIDTSDASCLEIPMAVLVNGDSYSAAEYFAAALREYGWAVVVGQPTTGKARSQITVALPDGGAVHISHYTYLTPHRVDLYETGGIVPDVVSELSEEEQTLYETGWLEPEDDPQVQAALQALSPP